MASHRFCCPAGAAGELVPPFTHMPARTAALLLGALLACSSALIAGAEADAEKAVCPLPAVSSRHSPCPDAQFNISPRPFLLTIIYTISFTLSDLPAANIFPSR